MKGLMYRWPGEVHCEDISDPQLPDDTGTVVQAIPCSICGTDLHPYYTDVSVGSNSLKKIVLGPTC